MRELRGALGHAANALQPRQLRAVDDCVLALEQHDAQRSARTWRSFAANASGWPDWPYSPPRKPPWLLGKMTGLSPSRSAVAWAPRHASSPSDSAPAAMMMWVDACRRASKSGW